MRFDLQYKVKCYNCPARDKADSGESLIHDEIEAADTMQAMNKFKEKHKLCSKCSNAGTKVRVTLEAIKVEQLPGFPVNQ